MRYLGLQPAHLGDLATSRARGKWCFSSTSLWSGWRVATKEGNRKESSHGNKKRKELLKGQWAQQQEMLQRGCRIKTARCPLGLASRGLLMNCRRAAGFLFGETMKLSNWRLVQRAADFSALDFAVNSQRVAYAGVPTRSSNMWSSGILH